MTRDELIKYRDNLLDFALKGEFEMCWEGGAHMSSEQYKRRKIYKNVIIYKLKLGSYKKKMIAQEIRFLDTLIDCQTKISSTQYRDHEIT